MMELKRKRLKILSTLSLAASETREDTLSSIIVSTLFDFDFLDREELSEWIKATFGFIPYKDELNELLDNLQKTDQIIIENKKFALSKEKRDSLTKQIRVLQDSEKKRLQNFESFIKYELSESISVKDVKLLWITFLDYIYDNFFEYGEEAIKRLNPHINLHDSYHVDEDFVQKGCESLKSQNLSRLFKVIIEKFPDFASKEDLDFLEELAQKSLSFASLGINPELSKISIEFASVDWVLYLDTNVLYSILGLHSHPENEACKALIRLINDNKNHLKIKLRYSELTRKELLAKREDFNDLQEQLTDSGISALLKSNKLDDFSRHYYENLLNNRENTLHPSKIIDIASNILVKESIDIARNKKRIENLGVDYLDTRIQDYRRYIDFKNDVKKEFSDKNKITYHPTLKSDKQIEHDIILRELIIDQRSQLMVRGEPPSFNSIKYYGITLDKHLRNYDTQQLSDSEDEKSFPVFFRPSFLLNQLIKVLPLKTADYKKAFIKAITSKGYNRDVKQTHNVVNLVNFLREYGIDDENIVLNLINKELFLDKFTKNINDPTFNSCEFVEAEINKEIKQKEKELEETKEKLHEYANKTELTAKYNEELKNRNSELEETKRLYKNALDKIQDRIKKLEESKVSKSIQTEINFEALEARKKLDETKEKLKPKIDLQIKDHIDRQLKKWKRRIWWNLFWVFPFTVFVVTFVLFPNIYIETQFDLTSLRILLSVFALLFDSIFIYLIKMRYWDEKNIETKRNQIPIPENISDMLKELR